jgi:uncharacterized protein YjbJ (UPF0337 family)
VIIVRMRTTMADIEAGASRIQHMNLAGGRQMNESTLKGKWNEMKGKVKEQWGDLTNDEIDRIEGRRDQLVGTIQQRYGRAKDEAEREVARWEERNGLR